jgi:hypothetical protein
MPIAASEFQCEIRRLLALFTRWFLAGAEADEQSAGLPCTRREPNLLLRKKVAYQGHLCGKKKNLIRSGLPRTGRICIPALEPLQPGGDGNGK